MICDPSIEIPQIWKRLKYLESKVSRLEKERKQLYISVPGMGIIPIGTDVRIDGVGELNGKYRVVGNTTDSIVMERM